MCVLCMFVSLSPVKCECFNIDRDACVVYVCVPEPCECFNIDRDVCAVYVCVPEPCEVWMFQYCQRCVRCVCLCSVSPVNCGCLNIARDVCAVYVCVPEPCELWMFKYCQRCVRCVCLCPWALWMFQYCQRCVRCVCLCSVSPVNCGCLNIARDVCAVYVCVPEPCELWMFKYCQRCVRCVCLCPWALWTVNVSILTEMCVLCMFMSLSPVNCECFNIARDVCAVYVCFPEPRELWMFKYCQRCVCCVCLCPRAQWTVNVSILTEMCVLCMFVSQSPVSVWDLPEDGHQDEGTDEVELQVIGHVPHPAHTLQQHISLSHI